MDQVIRRQRVLSSIKLSGSTRVLSIGVNLLLIPLMLQFLGDTHYGVWLTISSFLGWSSLLDMGVGNGLKNRLAESMAAKDFERSRAYTSSAYLFLSLIALGAWLLFSVVSLFLDWPSLLNTAELSAMPFRWVLIIFFGLFCMKVVLNQVVNIASAHANTAVMDVVNLSVNLLLLGALFLMQGSQGDRLFQVILLFGAIPVLTLLVVSAWAFIGPYRKFRPHFSALNLNLGKDVAKLGMRFFVIQLAGIVLFSTDHFIISHYLSPAEVAPYHISFRYFGVVTTFFSIICAPIWPAYTHAYALNDIAWIKRTTKRLIKIWGLIQALLIVMWLLGPWVYSAWVGQDVNIPRSLDFIMLLYVSALTWGMIFVTFINSVGKLRLQSICSIAAGIINIPLSIVLIKYTDLGSAAVMLATIVCLSYGPFLSVIQYSKLIRGKAKGIWAA